MTNTCHTCGSIVVESRQPVSLRQNQVVDFVAEYTAMHRMSPTLTEIGIALAITKHSAHHHVAELVRKGWLRKTPNTPRSLTLAAPGLTP